MGYELAKRQKFLVDLFKRAPITRFMSLNFYYDGEGNAVVEMPFNPNFNHAFKGVHGGAIATLMDTAAWFAAAQHFPVWIATTDLDVKYLQRVEETDLKAIGVCVRAGKSNAVSSVALFDANNESAAIATATFSATSVPLEKV